MTPLTDSEIAEMERLEREATKGPWCTHPNGTSVWNEEQYDGSNIANLDARILFQAPTGPKAVHWNQAVQDIDFVVELRNAAPALLAAAKEANRMRVQLVDAHREMTTARAGWAESARREAGLREQVATLRDALRETDRLHGLRCCGYCDLNHSECDCTCRTPAAQALASTLPDAAGGKGE